MPVRKIGNVGQWDNHEATPQTSFETMRRYLRRYPGHYFVWIVAEGEPAAHGQSGPTQDDPNDKLIWRTLLPPTVNHTVGFFYQEFYDNEQKIFTRGGVRRYHIHVSETWPEA